ncbi:hypothetical protein VNO78_12317 [Psophocarpus tetragonolobus]|uniref:Uncharacterized protein n=1 Tax=Psophocarpus tetragonolobus TaxID=3891 RepID=A0AAN9SN55_PSOTE
MVEALVVHLTQREGELVQEKAEASEDAKKLVNEERAFAPFEIENARAAVQRVEEALQEHERMSGASGKQFFQCIVCLFWLDHVSDSKVLVVLGLRGSENQNAASAKQEKSRLYLQLRKELVRTKNGEANVPHLYELEGSETLGSYLQIQPCSDYAPELSKWATKSVYAPEPFDVRRILQVHIISGQLITLSTTGPIDPGLVPIMSPVGLGTYVEALVRKHDSEFNEIVISTNLYRMQWVLDFTSESITDLWISHTVVDLALDTRSLQYV